MDIKTLVVCNTVLPFFVGLILLFFRSQQKTFPGFGFWTLGSFLMGAAYVALYLRLLGWELASILINNGLFVLVALVRLEGTRLFMRGAPLPWGAYVLTGLVVAAMGVLLRAEAGLWARNLVTSGVICAVSILVIRELFKYAPASGRTLYRATGWVYIVFACFIMTRALLLVISPGGGLMEAKGTVALYFFSTMLFEMAWMLSFVLMNSQRLEDELNQTVKRLKTTLSELKTLSGLLPICANCKKVRDDQGYWRQIEQYITEHSQAAFSHGICPDCVAKLYPDLNLPSASGPPAVIEEPQGPNPSANPSESPEKA